MGANTYQPLRHMARILYSKLTFATLRVLYLELVWILFTKRGKSFLTIRQALRLGVMQGIYEKHSKAYKWYGARVSQYITQQYAKSAYGTSDLVACQVSTAQRMGR